MTTRFSLPGVETGHVEPQQEDPHNPDAPPDETEERQKIDRLNSARRGPQGGEAGFGQSRGVSAYDVDQQVLLALEFVPDAMVKWGTVLTRTDHLVTLALLIFLASRKLHLGVAGLLEHNVLGWINIVVACVCLSFTLGSLVFFMWRLHRANISGRKWSHVRKVIVYLQLLKLVFLTIDLTVYLIAAASWFAAYCRHFTTLLKVCGIVQLSAILTIFMLLNIDAHCTLPLRNGKVPWWCAPLHTVWMKMSGQKLPSGAKYVIDLPLHVHLEKVLIVWLPGQILLLFTLLNSLGHVGDSGEVTCPDQSQSCLRPPPGQTCVDWMSNTLGDVCITDTTASLILTSFTVAWVIGALVTGLIYLSLAYHELARWRYQDHRAANITVRTMGPRLVSLIVVVVACMVCFWYIDMDSCASYLVLTYGFAPLQVLLTMHVLDLAYAFVPMPAKKRELGLHIWLQSFAWTEEEKPEKLALRPPLYVKEPMFCFETALKALYLSELVYYYDGSDELKMPDNATEAVRQQASTLSLAMALTFCGLTKHEAVLDKEQDLTCMIAWGQATRTIVLTFRGTASLANVWLDLQVWRRPHPVGYGGHWWSNTQPMVHAGFHNCWMKHGFGERVCQRVREIITADGLQGEAAPWRVYCFGHSLGGALACLAAADLQQMAHELSANVEQTEFDAESQRAERSVALEEARSGSVHHEEAFVASATDNNGHASLRSPHDAHHHYHHRPSPAPGSFTSQLSAFPPLILTISSYTYGCPRLGNHAYARLYSKWVPDGFVRLYKRAAHRVIVSPQGDMIVRPSLAETTVLRGHSSVQSHLLGSYSRSLSAILKAQAGTMGDESSRSAVISLISKAYVAQILTAAAAASTIDRKSLLEKLEKLPADQSVVTGDYLATDDGTQAPSPGGDEEQASAPARVLLGLERVSGIVQQAENYLGESGNMLREFFGDWYRLGHA